MKRELVRAQEEIKRIQSVPLVIGQFMEAIDQKCVAPLYLELAGGSYSDRPPQYRHRPELNRIKLCCQDSFYA